MPLTTFGHTRPEQGVEARAHRARARARIRTMSAPRRILFVRPDVTIGDGIRFQGLSRGDFPLDNANKQVR